MDKNRVKHFLVLEDDPNDADFIARAFRAVPFCTSYVCRNPGEARAYVLGSGLYSDRLNFPFPNGLICDLRLGSNESGIDFLRWWASHELTKSIPFVVLAGAPAFDETLAAKALGAKKVLTKPAGLHSLRCMLGELIDDLCGTCDLTGQS